MPFPVVFHKLHDVDILIFHALIKSPPLHKFEPKNFHQDNALLKLITRYDIIDLLQLGFRIVFTHTWLTGCKGLLH